MEELIFIPESNPALVPPDPSRPPAPAGDSFPATEFITRPTGPQLSRPMPEPLLAPGEHVGPYRIEGGLGQGGMGVVYRAWDEELHRPVALKMMSAELAADARNVERLKTEARAAARLTHSGIVSVYTIGEHQGRPYIAMEFVDGRDLAAVMADSGPLPIARAIHLTRQSAEALAYAAEQQILHRDIKPANIMLSSSGQAKVMDFGLAKRLDVESHLTMTGLVMGTPSYMSPEQARGVPLDLRSDIYSLGMTLYTLLSGRRPYNDGTPFEVMMRHVQEPLAVPAAWRGQLGGRLVAVLERMTAKDAAQRFASWPELVRELRVLEELAAPLGDLRAGDGPPAPPPRARRALPPLRIAVGGIAAVVLLVAIGGWLANSRSASPPAAVVSAAPSTTVRPVIPAELTAPPAPAAEEISRPGPARSGPFGPMGGDDRPQRRPGGRPGAVVSPPGEIGRFITILRPTLGEVRAAAQRGDLPAAMAALGAGLTPGTPPPSGIDPREWRARLSLRGGLASAHAYRQHFPAQATVADIQQAATADLQDALRDPAHADPERAAVAMLYLCATDNQHAASAAQAIERIPNPGGGPLATLRDDFAEALLALHNDTARPNN